jgi:hypothetical protein
VPIESQWVGCFREGSGLTSNWTEKQGHWSEVYDQWPDRSQRAAIAVLQNWPRTFCHAKHGFIGNKPLCGYSGFLSSVAGSVVAGASGLAGSAFAGSAGFSSLCSW